MMNGQFETDRTLTFLRHANVRDNTRRANDTIGICRRGPADEFRSHGHEVHHFDR